MNSVSSNAVYKAVVTDKTFYYDSNGDRRDTSARSSAIRTLVLSDYNNKNLGGIGTIRYDGGYYYTYIWSTQVTTSEHCVLEINPYGTAELNIWQISNGVYTLKRTI